MVPSRAILVLLLMGAPVGAERDSASLDAVPCPVTVCTEGAGTVSVSPQYYCRPIGICCEIDLWCPMHVPPPPLTIVLTASPDRTYNFIGWGGTCAGCGDEPTCAVTYAANCLATFGRLPGFSTVTPCRMLDTRQRGAGIAAGATERLALPAEPCGIADDAVALSVNVTVTMGGAPGALRLFDALPAPLASVINWRQGATRANNALVKVDQLQVYAQNDSAAPVHLIIDVNGYFR